MPSSLPRGCPAPLRCTGAVYCLRREMSGSASPTFRVLMSRGCKVRMMLGLWTCSPPPSLTARRGLLTPHSDGKVSLDARGLLRGASALTATGLSPASSIQRESPRMAIRSGRTISAILSSAPSAPIAELVSSASHLIQSQQIAGSMPLPTARSRIVRSGGRYWAD
jgi:hypothetical protein